MSQGAGYRDRRYSRSWNRITPGALGILIFNHALLRPEMYLLSRRLLTMPSRPISQACLNATAPSPVFLRCLDIKTEDCITEPCLISFQALLRVTVTAPYFDAFESAAPLFFSIRSECKFRGRQFTHLRARNRSRFLSTFH
jgi:hypothetical protein